MNAKSQNINQWDFQDIFMAIFFIAAFIFLYFGLTQFFNLDTHSVIYLVTTQVILYFIGIILVLYFAVFQKANSFRIFLGTENSTKMVYYGVVVFAIIIFATTLIDTFFTFLGQEKSAAVYQNIDKSLLKTLSFVAVFFAPFSEEIFFRGFLQPVFVNKFGKIVGIISISLLFSLLHILYINNISALISIIFIGFILSITKEKTNSLIPGMVAHFLNNFAAAISLVGQ